MSNVGEHRVTMLGASWRRFDDPVRSRDPRVRAVVTALGELPIPGPRPEFRADLRTQLVAITPRIVGESRSDLDFVPRPAPVRRPRPHPVSGTGRVVPATGPQHADGILDRLSGIRVGRPLTIAASVLVAFVLLLGGAVWMSRSALPGDSLYGLKRAGENLELATAGSQSEKAQDYLSFASTRADEVRDLLGRASVSAAGSGANASGISSGTASLVASTLGSADSDVRSAATILGNQAVHSGSAAPLATMTKWAPSQLTKLDGIASSLPAGSVRTRVEQSAQLVERALARAQALAPSLGCSCLATAGSDDLGPKPCTSCGTPATGQPGKSASNPTTPGRQHGTVPGTAGGSAGIQPGSTGNAPHAGTSSTPGAPPPSSSSTPGVPSLPGLPLPTSSLPVGVSTCGVAATLGPLSLGLGLCPSASVGLSLGP
jgi:hypothetical protein